MAHLNNRINEVLYLMKIASEKLVDCKVPMQSWGDYQMYIKIKILDNVWYRHEIIRKTGEIIE